MLALALSLAAAGEASAAVESSGGFKYVTKSFTLKPGKARTNRAECPKRTHVLSGGHYNSGGFGDVIGSHSYPYDGDDRNTEPDDGWAAQQRGFGDSYPASIHAICARTLPEYLTTQIIVDAGTEGGDLLVCDPPTLKATGGGSRGPASVREIEGYPAFDSGDSGWSASFANHSNGTRQVTEYAVCSNLAADYQHGNLVSGAVRAQTVARVACPPGAPHVIGGGLYRTQNDVETAIAAISPGSDRGSWDVWLDNYSHSSTFDMRADAICSPPL